MSNSCWARKMMKYLQEDFFAMTILITLVHVIVCFFLIAVVLLQSGKSGDLAAAFGGQGSQTAFGPRGAASVLCSATNGAIVRAFGSEADADEVSARDSVRAVRTADRSAKPSADTEIIC